MANAAPSGTNGNSRPVQVTWAARLLCAALLAALLAGIPEYLEPVSPGSGILQWLVWALIAVGFGIGAVITVLISRGHNWARIVALIFFITDLALWVRGYELLPRLK